MIALLVACASPEVDLRAVTAVAGNVDLTATTRNARAILALGGLPTVPVAPGAERPLVRAAPARPRRAHGAGGLGGLQLPEPPAPAERRHAVDLLADRIGGSPEPPTLVAIGPLTNVALLYARYPDVAARLGRLVVMGSSPTGVPAIEFNVATDPEAAYRVLSDPGLPRPVPTTLVGLDSTLRVRLDVSDVDRLARAGPVGRAVADALAGHDGLRQGRGVPVHDAVALAAAVQPDLVRTRAVDVIVECAPDEHRGAVRLVSGATVDLVVDVDAGEVREFVLDRLTRGAG